MADKTLISGAKDAAKAQGAGNLAGANALSAIGQHLSEGIGKVIQKRNQEFNKLMKAELAAHGELSDEEYQDLFKELQSKRGGYVYLNKRGRVQAEKELEDLAKAKETDPTPEIIGGMLESEEPGPCNCLKQGTEKRIEGDKTVFDVDPRTEWALEHAPDEVLYTPEGEPYIPSYEQAWTNTDRFGNEMENPRFTTSADGLTKTSIHGHIYPNTPEGQMMFRAHAESDWQIAGGQALDFTNQETLEATWYKSKTYKEMQSKDIKDTESWAQGNDKVTMSGEEYQSLIKKFSMDEGSQQKVRTVVEAVTADATAFTGGDTTKEFNFEATKQNVMNNIINSKEANLHSLASHNIWGSTSWKTDMEEALQNGSYGDLGITTGDFEDPTPNDNKITPEDAQKISKSIMENTDLLKQTLGDYYTKIAERNYNAQTGKNKKNNNDNTNTDYE